MTSEQRAQLHGAFRMLLQKHERALAARHLMHPKTVAAAVRLGEAASHAERMVDAAIDDVIDQIADVFLTIEPGNR